MNSWRSIPSDFEEFSGVAPRFVINVFEIGLAVLISRWRRCVFEIGGGLFLLPPYISKICIFMRITLKDEYPR